MDLAEPPPVIAGYPVVRFVGRGGMGAVYLVKHPRIGRLQALKVISPALTGDPAVRQRFLREARLAAAVEHPHLVSVYDQDEAEGLMFLTMQWIDGVDLAGALRNGHPISASHLVTGLWQIASALDAVHAAGLVHRDVKSSNILVAKAAATGRAHWVLSDFGIARALDDAGDLTGDAFVGSVPYTAPERLEGDPGSVAADVFALACVAAEALTGRTPYGNSLVEVVRAHSKAVAPAGIDMLPSRIERVLRRALSAHPEQRHASAGDFALDLASAMEPRRPAAAAQPDGAHEHW